jgi:hypothetical protein
MRCQAAEAEVVELRAEVCGGQQGTKTKVWFHYHKAEVIELRAEVRGSGKESKQRLACCQQ